MFAARVSYTVTENKIIPIAETFDEKVNTWITILNDTKHLQDEYDKRVEAKNRIRNAALERFHAFNDEQPNLANTPWAIW